MSIKAFIYIFLWHSCFIANGQSFFNIIPEIESIEGQGSCLAIYNLDNEFLIFGNRYDTSYIGTNAKPWLGRMNYHGELLEQFSLRDFNYLDNFNVARQTYAKFHNNHWYGYSGRFIDSHSTPYIFLLNVLTGEIENSRLLPNMDYPMGKMAPTKMFYKDNKLSLLSYQQDADSTRLYITELDTNLNYLREFRVSSTSRKQFPDYFIREKDGTYTIILDSYVSSNEGYNLSFLHVSSNGAIIDFRWSPSDHQMSNLLTYAKNVIKDNEGNWILLAHQLINYPDSCLNCAVQIPYISSVTANFDSILWVTRFFDIPHIVGPNYHVYALTQVEDGYIGAGELLKNLNGHPISGTLFKAGLNGDSLWMKHYIPLNWENSRVRVARLYDIKTTPEGTIIAAGEVYDDSLKGLFPWILHLDSDGCLVPGCNTVSSVTTPSETSWTDSKFVMYPNPVSDMLYILSRVTSAEPYLISLVKPDGTVSRSTQFLVNEGSQYTLPLENMPVGSYFIVISDPKTGFVETHNIVKL